MDIQPLNGRVMVKLENVAIKKTASGLVYDESFRRKPYAYGHVYAIGEKEQKKLGLKVGDRVLFLKDYAEQITFKSKQTGVIIPVVLLAIDAEFGVLAVCEEEYSVMDFLQED